MVQWGPIVQYNISTYLLNQIKPINRIEYSTVTIFDLTYAELSVWLGVCWSYTGPIWKIINPIEAITNCSTTKGIYLPEIWVL